MSDAARIVRVIDVWGRVQGVGYRAWTVRRAREFDLKGWVRNRRDGRVEILVEGPERAVLALGEACWSGPRGARVDRVAIREAASGEGVGLGHWGFVERPTM